MKNVLFGLILTVGLVAGTASIANDRGQLRSVLSRQQCIAQRLAGIPVEQLANRPSYTRRVMNSDANLIDRPGAVSEATMNSAVCVSRISVISTWNPLPEPMPTAAIISALNVGADALSPVNSVQKIRLMARSNLFSLRWLKPIQFQASAFPGLAATTLLNRILAFS